MIDNVDMPLLFWWGGKETSTPRHDPYKYSIRKQRLSTNHSVAMSDMSNLHHNCNIWIIPCVDKELALRPNMNTCRERKPTKSGVQDDWILVCVQISRCYDNPTVVFMSCPWCIERLECFWEHKWSIKTIASYGEFAWIALVWVSTPPTIALGYFVLIDQLQLMRNNTHLVLHTALEIELWILKKLCQCNWITCQHLQH